MVSLERNKEITRGLKTTRNFIISSSETIDQLLERYISIPFKTEFDNYFIRCLHNCILQAFYKEFL